MLGLALLLLCFTVYANRTKLVPNVCVDQSSSDWESLASSAAMEYCKVQGPTTVSMQDLVNANLVLVRDSFGSFPPLIVDVDPQARTTVIRHAVTGQELGSSITSQSSTLTSLFWKNGTLLTYYQNRANGHLIFYRVGNIIDLRHTPFSQYKIYIDRYSAYFIDPIGKRYDLEMVGWVDERSISAP
jgi:hypothetical protein